MICVGDAMQPTTEPYSVSRFIRRHGIATVLFLCVAATGVCVCYPTKHNVEVSNLTDQEFRLVSLSLSTWQQNEERRPEVPVLAAGESQIFELRDRISEAGYVVHVSINNEPLELPACGFSIGPWQLSLSYRIIVDWDQERGYFAYCDFSD